MGAGFLSVGDEVLQHAILRTIDLGGELLALGDRVGEVLLLKGSWHSYVLEAGGSSHWTNGIEGVSSLLVSLLASVSGSAGRACKLVSA